MAVSKMCRCMCASMHLYMDGSVPIQYSIIDWQSTRIVVQELSYHKQIVCQLRTQYVEGVSE